LVAFQVPYVKNVAPGYRQPEHRTCCTPIDRAKHRLVDAVIYQQRVRMLQAELLHTIDERTAHGYHARGSTKSPAQLQPDERVARHQVDVTAMHLDDRGHT